MAKTQETGSRAYLFSIVLVAIIGGLLFGYDTAVVSGAEQALDQFFRSAADFTYTPWMHGFTASSALVGCVIGGALSGLLASRLGRKRSLVAAAVLFFVSAVGSWRPESGILPYGEASLPLLASFNIYRILGGIGVGLASAVCPMYIAEISPAKIRGTLVSCNQFAIIFGMLVVYFVNYLIRNNLGDTGEAIQAAMVSVGWRRMFLSEAFPAATFLLLILFVPETPRYLTLTGHDQKALQVLTRINGAAEARTIHTEIRRTVHAKTERLFAYGAAVILIGILLSFFQQAIGINVVLYYAPRIFAGMGASGDASMLQTVVMGVVNILFTVVAIYRGPRGPQTAAHRRFGGYDDRHGRPCGAFVHRVDRHCGTGLHHHLHSIVHDVVGADLLGADLRNLPQHDPLAGRGRSRGGAVDLEFPRLGDLPLTERMERRRHLLHLCPDVARFGSLRLEMGTRNQGQNPRRDVETLAEKRRLSRGKNRHCRRTGRPGRAGGHRGGPGKPDRAGQADARAELKDRAGRIRK